MFVPCRTGGENINPVKLCSNDEQLKADPDLAGIREGSALAKLPENEQKACGALWAEVEVLLKKAQSP